MRKLLTILTSISLTANTSVAVIACEQQINRANPKDLFSIESKSEKLVINEEGKQTDPFNFSLNYAENSPMTGRETNIRIQSADIANENENSSDDTRRYGKFFTVEEDKTFQSDNKQEINYSLKFTGNIEDFAYHSASEPFNLAVNFKGRYFNDEQFSVTLYFKFILINYYQKQNSNDDDIYSLTKISATKNTLELDENGNQTQDFNFDLTYFLKSSTGKETNIKINNTAIATKSENASDDTLRYGNFFSIEENGKNEGKNDYLLKFNSNMIKDFGEISIKDFNFSVNFKGTYFEGKTFSLTLNFHFDLINHYYNDQRQDLQDFIPENQRDLGIIEKLNDVIPQKEAENLIKNKIYENYPSIASEVDLKIFLDKKEIQIVAHLDSNKFKNQVTLTYDHDKNPDLLPNVSEGISLKALSIDRLEFDNLDSEARFQLVKDSLKEWYLIEKGQDFTNLYFQYFKIENSTIDVDTTEILILFETPWKELNQKFKAKIKIPYASMETSISENLFSENLWDMDSTTSDEFLLSKLNLKANEQILNFNDDFKLNNLNVVDQTIDIVAKNKNQFQIYEPNAKLTLNFNVQKLNLEDLIGEKLRNYHFDAKSKDVWYLTLKEFALGRMREDINSKLTENEKTLITLDNEFNDSEFDTTDPDHWTVKITPSLNAQRYLKGEITFKYDNPKQSGLDTPIADTYDTPGRKQTLQLDAPFLVSSQEEIQNSYLKTLQEVAAGNPFSKWIILDNPQSIDETIPDKINSYKLFGNEKIQQYLRNNEKPEGKFRLAALNLEEYFFNGINIDTVLDSTTPNEIAQELYEMIIGDRISHFPPIKNFANVVQVVNVNLEQGAIMGTAKLIVREDYQYKNFVLNEAMIKFKYGFKLN